MASIELMKVTVKLSESDRDKELTGVLISHEEYELYQSIQKGYNNLQQDNNELLERIREMEDTIQELQAKITDAGISMWDVYSKLWLQK